jgi:hypothetical protein
VSGFGSGEAVVDSIAALGNDPRAFIYEPEWSRTLRIADRNGSTLSDLVRQCWDGGKLEVRSRAGISIAEDAQVTILSAITNEELVHRTQKIQLVNGFANRHLFILVRRSQLIPSGSSVPISDVHSLAEVLRTRLRNARSIGLMHRTPAAEGLWESVYNNLAQDDPGGLLGEVIARSDAQVLRLSVIYATLDGGAEIDMEHLEAALALWNYCRASAEWCFASAASEADLQKLLHAIQSAPEGLSVSDQHKTFGRNLYGGYIEQLRTVLETRGLIETHEVQNTGGRPKRVSVAV